MGDAEAKDGGYSGQVKEMLRPGIEDAEARYRGRRGQVWLILWLGVGGMLRPGMGDAEVRVQRMLTPGLGGAGGRFAGCLDQVMGMLGPSIGNTKGKYGGC